MEKIASRSQNIIEINISDCRSMSDTGVCVLAFKCPGLLRYTAYRCKQLSDTSIIAVASHCPLLQKVHVGNQDKLTDEGLKQVNFSIYKMVLLVLTQHVFLQQHFERLLCCSNIHSNIRIVMFRD